MATIAERINKAKQDNRKANGKGTAARSIEERIRMAKQDSKPAMGSTLSTPSGAAGTTSPVKGEAGGVGASTATLGKSDIEHRMKQAGATIFSANQRITGYSRAGNMGAALEAERKRYASAQAEYNSLQQMLAQLDQAEKKYSLGKGLAGVAQKGLSQIAQAGGATLAFVEDVISAPFELISGQRLGDLSNTGPLNRWNDAIKREAQEINDYYAENVEAGGKAAELFDRYGAGAVAALPQAIAAWLTAGTSVVAQSTAGLSQVATAASNPGIRSTLLNMVQNSANNPQYWLSFANTVGGDYEEALADGVSPETAALYAIGSSLLNAEIEVGGGIQTLPDELKQGKDGFLRLLVDTAVDEGKEEIEQGAVSRTMQNLIYGKDNPVFSTTDPNAILNPYTAADEFAGGAFAGGLLGGGQIGLSRAGQALYNAAAKRTQAQQETTQEMQNAASEMEVAGTTQPPAVTPSTPAVGDDVTAAAGANIAGQLISAGATQADAETLAPLLSAVLNGEEISGNQAGAIAKNEAAVSILESAIGETINTDAPLGEVKTAIRGLASRHSAQVEQTATENTPAQVRPVEAQERPLAPASLPASVPPVATNGEASVQEFAAERSAGKDLVNGQETRYTETEGARANEEVHLRTGGQWTDGTHSGGAVSAVESRAGGNRVRQEQGRPADPEAASLTYGEAVSTASLGIGKGSDKATIRVVTGGDTTDTRTAKQLAKERGLRLTLFVGDNLNINGESVRAYITGDRAFVRADHSDFTSAQLMRHETGHDMIAKGEIDPQTVRERIAERFGGEQLDHVTQMYIEAYTGSGLTAEEIWEEIICDSLGDMNIFSETVSEDAARELLTATKATSADAKAETSRGPPVGEGKMSRDLDERRRALRKGEMVNEFRDKVNWKNYYQKIISDEYNPDYFDDGDIARMPLDGVILKMKMLRNGEWSVVGIEEDVVYGGSKKDSGRADSPDAGTELSEERGTDSDLLDQNSGESGADGARNQTFDRSGADTQRGREGNPTDHSGTGLIEGEASIELERPKVERAAERYRALIEEYGSIAHGENPAREVQVPKRTADNQKVSQTVRTILEAGVTPEEIIPDVEKLVADGDFSYEKHTDKQAISNAENTIRRVGWAQALSDWMGDVKSGTVSKRNTAMGWALYNNAANSGDVQTAITILDQMVAHQRSAAQALQATRILKKLSPETQLYQVQRSVENLQEELNERFGEKGGPVLKVDEELAEQFMRAKDQEERDAVLKDIYRDIGRQMPSTFRDKWNAWRYLAMLCNARTHVRNIVGNAGFAPVVLAKNLTASAIEETVYRVSGGRTERSKGLLGVGKQDRDLLSAAWEDYSTVQETAMNGGKYSDFANANRYIEEGRVIFKNRALEKARKGNSKALDVEDQWFFRPHYAAALAQYCKANGITASQIRSGVGMDRAHAYAVKEAQKATYRDTNAFSQTISELGRYRGNNKVKQGIGVALEGILPFRKTPANILVRGLEYSPLGLVNGIKQAVWDVKRGNKTAAEAIDSISAGLTGTGLLALGAFLAAQGLVRGSGGDDEEKNEFEELQGHQAYALELPDGTSVTLDWLAPEVLPFFVGVNLWEQTASKDDGGVTMSEILTATANVTEPLLEMSCLQSLNDVFDAVGYASSDGLSALPSTLASAATSYLTQGFPTILGQAERTGEDRRMTTYTEKNAFLTPDMQYTVGRISARLPGLDYQQIPYIDAWGRIESSGNAAERAGNNFLNPAYTSTVETSPMEDELLRLYEQTGDGGVLPSRAAKYFNVDGERKDLAAQEYVKYAQAKGQTAYKVLTALSGSEAYRKMSDAEKVEAVGLVYDYANATAKTKVSGYKPEGWIAKAVKTEKATGVKAEQYVTLYLAQKDIESLKEADGDTIANSKSLLVMEMVYNVKGLTDTQRRALFEDFGVGKTVIHWNKALVQEKLKAMRKKTA